MRMDFVQRERERAKKIQSQKLRADVDMLARYLVYVIIIIAQREDFSLSLFRLCNGPHARRGWQANESMRTIIWLVAQRASQKQ